MRPADWSDASPPRQHPGQRPDPDAARALRDGFDRRCAASCRQGFLTQRRRGAKTQRVSGGGSPGITGSPGRFPTPNPPFAFLHPPYLTRVGRLAHMLRPPNLPTAVRGEKRSTFFPTPTRRFWSAAACRRFGKREQAPALHTGRRSFTTLNRIHLIGYP